MDKETKILRLRELAAGLGDLLASKQAQYGDSVGATSEILRQLYPDGITPENYDGLQLVVRILDKCKRIATHGLGNDLGHENPMLDIAGYGLLGVELAERRALDTTQQREPAIACTGCRFLGSVSVDSLLEQVCRKTNRPTRDAIIYRPNTHRPGWCPGREENTP